MEFGPLVGAAWLREHLGEPDLRVIDVRWYLDGRSGRESYESGHIPGAAFVDIETELSGPPGPGRHPLPDPPVLAAAMRRAGGGASSRVVAYDDAGGSVAERLWWLLRHHGHGAGAVLDGGIEAWDGPLRTGEEAPPEGDFIPAPSLVPPPLERAEVAAGAGGAILLDARLPERFRGEVEPVDARAGHIPGARSAPWTRALQPSGRFRSPADLRRWLAGLGVTRGQDAAVYCGSGITACLLALAMEQAGTGPPRLYPGSWSDWISVPGAPIE